jgi:hypothetical protein
MADALTPPGSFDPRQCKGMWKWQIRNRQLDPKWAGEDPAPDPPRAHPRTHPRARGHKKNVLTADSLSL